MKRILTACLTLLPALLMAAEDFNIRHIRSLYDIAGRTLSIAADSSHLYQLTDGTGLRIYALEGESEPRLIGKLPLYAWDGSIALIGNRLFITTTGDSLLLFDVSNPASPQIIKKFTFPERIYGLTAWPEGLIINHRNIRFTTYRLTEEDSLIELRSVAVPDGSSAMFFAGDFAYVTKRDSGLYVYDISVPAQPVLLGSCAIRYASSLWIDGDYAYVTDNVDGVYPNGLSIVNVSDKRAPFVEGFYETQYAATSVRVRGDMVYLLDSYIDISHGSSWRSSLLSINVSDHSAPVLWGQIAIQHPSGLMLAGTRLFLGDTDWGIHVCDISEGVARPLTPLLREQYLQHVTIENGRAFIAAGTDGIRVVQNLGVWPTETAKVITPHEAVKVVADRSTLVNLAQEWRGFDGNIEPGYDLFKIDERGVANLREIDNIRFSYVPDVEIAGNRLFIYDWVLFEAKVDYPVESYYRYLTFPDYVVNDMEFEDGYLYVAGFNSNRGTGRVGVESGLVEIFDVSGSDSARSVALIEFECQQDRIQVSEGKLIVGHHGYYEIPSGISIFDVSNPAAPEALISEWRIERYQDFALSEDRLTIMADQTIVIYDYSNLDSLRETGRFSLTFPEFGHWTNEIAQEGQYLAIRSSVSADFFDCSAALDLPAAPSTPLLSRLYPNPTNGALFYEIDANRAGELRYELFDIQGRRVTGGTTKLRAGMNRSQLIDSPAIDLLSGGRYYVRLSRDGREIVRPVVILR